MLLLLLNGILVHRWVTSSNRSPVPTYTPGWRETKWSRINCLRKQGDGRGFNPGPPEFVVLSARPHMPPFWGEGLTGVPTVKPLRTRARIKQQTQLTYGAASGNWTWAGHMSDGSGHAQSPLHHSCSPSLSQCCWPWGKGRDIYNFLL